MDHSHGAQRHFARIAPIYGRFRDTDPDVVDTIIAKLPRNQSSLQVADVGCGTGRYSDVIADRFNGNLRLFCCDYSEAMLRECRERMNRAFPAKPFHFCRARADSLPFTADSLDGVVTFNAIHHFDLDRFVAEAARVLRLGGLLAVYTRTPQQNARTVWGQHFPGFVERETRLFPRERLERAVLSAPSLKLQDVHEFTHIRIESPNSLVERARNFHYSTFALYPPEEFTRALATFAQRLSCLGDGDIEHLAENTLLLARRTGR